MFDDFELSCGVFTAWLDDVGDGRSGDSVAREDGNVDCFWQFAHIGGERVLAAIIIVGIDALPDGVPARISLPGVEGLVEVPEAANGPQHRIPLTRA